MPETIRILYQGGSAELVEKKSRFIAETLPVHTEEEAQAFLAATRKKYWDARHHCWAYVIGARQELARCSDDGEPQGTAGRPILDALLGEGVHDAMLVVTRYFGGVLLGTGGLVRAYGGAASLGLKQSTVLERVPGCRLTVRSDYNAMGKIQYLVAQRGLPVEDTRYTDLVEMDVLVPRDKEEELRSAITDGTGGKAGFPAREELFYGLLGKETVILS